MTENENRQRNSTETILTFANRSISEWSTVLSTTHVPGMDAAMGGDGSSRRTRGRRRLRAGTFALGSLLAMHCRITASAISGGFFVFIMFLVAAVAFLANPLRHFEIYLGQWSISGPGRAFRMVPMFDGIGIAICINAIIRAIVCCTMASMTAVYVLHSVSDSRLPFTYCRDFDLISYEPTMQEVKGLRDLENVESVTIAPAKVGLNEIAWRNVSSTSLNNLKKLELTRHIAMCKEVYNGSYPPFFGTPAYNFFFVEVVHLQPDLSVKNFNVALMVCLIIAWLSLWGVMISEKISHGRLIWNNMYSCFVVVPWIWAILLMLTAILNIPSMQHVLQKTFHLETMDIVSAAGDALEVAMYTHSASVGTEIILGKGLNHYAAGHIDPNLNPENVWHSGLVLLLAVLNSISSDFCAIADLMQVTTQEAHVLHESTLWIIPMYSKCTSTGSYSHLLSTLIFAGLTFSYLVVAYTLLKTALHIIFEYKVKLVFIEQSIVGILIVTCMVLSLIVVLIGGIAMLESLDAVMTGLAMPLLCFQELVVMLWVYRSHDFVSDMNIATEENACPTRIGTQWQIIPFIVLLTFILKVTVLTMTELPHRHLNWALLPLAAVVVAVPVRAISNAYNFFGSSK
ncbi:hypothetical protein evm_004392 [Chilo suppressalis]|nr:hypothetical protein evm_004392 [Chilo suppressalis]